MPRGISHLRVMRDISEPFENFIEDPEPPSQKRGPLLCQPPSSLTFNVRALDYALRTVRAADEGQIIVEARQKAGRPKRQLTCWRHTRLTGFSPIPRPCGLPKPSTSPRDMFVYTEILKSTIPLTATMRSDSFPNLWRLRAGAPSTTPPQVWRSKCLVMKCMPTRHPARKRPG
ncbi:hypothetical protein U0027_25310 (plasmid) [Agrobacterium tumefaciens]|uniref:hypothetical protein n=2 Tax=Agrobacterium tumefaciens TaxID=358 RepID=UPI002B40145E|nr:hypothetical protein [Agrobacterium tumefaciens]WQE43356.1 hypothetical protein U0027_25310 [Agrobacterium tumefaciens]